MNEKTEKSSIDTLAEKMQKLQEENDVKACNLDSPEDCLECGS